MKLKERFVCCLLLFAFSSCTASDDDFTVSKEDLGNVKVIAHRGYWYTQGSAQNSLTAVRLAYENNLNGVEIDVRMSADGVLYLNHDPHYLGNIINSTNSEILDKLKLQNGETLPRFENFIELVKDYHDFEFYVEIKSAGNENHRKTMTEQVVERLVNADLINQTTILSFDKSILKFAKTKNSSTKTMFITDKLFVFSEDDNLIFDKIGFAYKMAINNPQFVQTAVNNGFEINVWTINDASIVRRVLNYPIISITTDKPNIFK